jgi:hypothetical protein
VIKRTRAGKDGSRALGIFFWQGKARGQRFLDEVEVLEDIVKEVSMRGARW